MTTGYTTIAAPAHWTLKYERGENEKPEAEPLAVLSVLIPDNVLGAASTTYAVLGDGTAVALGSETWIESDTSTITAVMSLEDLVG